MNKAAELHLTIEEEQLDILALCETWMPLDAPDAISLDIASYGYTVINAPRECGRRGGGLAIIHQEDIKVTRVHIKSKPTTFEALVVKIVVGVERFSLANIYRPPGGEIIAFLDELTNE